MHENCAEKHNTAPACRRVRTGRRRRGAVISLPVLMFAVAMLLPAPKARAVDSYEAIDTQTDPFCQISQEFSDDAFKLPGLGGSYLFTPSGNFMEGPAVGKARLTGVATNGTREFAVDLVVEGRLNPGDTGYSDTCRQLLLRTECGADSAEWRVYTSLSGTLTGTAGDVDGAVYNVSLRPLPKATCTEDAATLPDFPVPVAQVGNGANTHNLALGGFAPLSLELANPEDFSSLPAGPFAGEMSLNLENLNSSFPTPSPSLTGTWEGSIDCAGIADFTDAETFSGPVTLKVGARSGLNYDVELSDGAGPIAAYCAEYTNDLQVNTNQGTGRMTGSDPAQSPVLLKVRNNPGSNATLKARELTLLPDGPDVNDMPDGLNFCKWTFTQTNTADPGVPPVCVPAVCGNGVIENSESCDDGNTTGGDTCNSTCSGSQ